MSNSQTVSARWIAHRITGNLSHVSNKRMSLSCDLGKVLSYYKQYSAIC